MVLTISDQNRIWLVGVQCGQPTNDATRLSLWSAETSTPICPAGQEQWLAPARRACGGPGSPRTESVNAPCHRVLKTNVLLEARRRGHWRTCGSGKGLLQGLSRARNWLSRGKQVWFYRSRLVMSNAQRQIHHARFTGFSIQTIHQLRQGVVLAQWLCSTGGLLFGNRVSLPLRLCIP